MRDIKKIIIHCSATPNGRHETVQDIDRWHKERGWMGIGYHYVVTVNGVGEKGRQRELIGAHCKGHNKDSIGICLVGTDKFTRGQWLIIRGMIRQLEVEYKGCRIHGHNELNQNKTCPGFSVKDWLRGDKEPLENHLLSLEP